MIDILNIKYKIVNIFFFFLFSFFFFLSPYPVGAQSLSLSVVPPVLEVTVQPGRTATYTIIIQNNGTPTTLVPKIVNYTLTGFKDTQEPSSNNWLKIENINLGLEKPFLLKSGEQKKVNLQISPPKNIEETDYYQALIFSTSPNPAEEKYQTSFSPQIGTILLIRVTSTGMLEKKAEISDFSLPWIHDSFTPLKLAVTVKNTGNTYIRPLGQIRLSGIIGSGSYEIIPKVILKDESKLIYTQNTDSPNQQPIHTLTLAGFFIGKYKVELNLSLHQSQLKLKQEKVFYAFPYKLVSVLVLFTGATFIFLKVKKSDN